MCNLSSEWVKEVGTRERERACVYVECCTYLWERYRHVEWVNGWTVVHFWAMERQWMDCCTHSCCNRVPPCVPCCSTFLDDTLPVKLHTNSVSHQKEEEEKKRKFCRWRKVENKNENLRKSFGREWCDVTVVFKLIVQLHSRLHTHARRVSMQAPAYLSSSSPVDMFLWSAVDSSLHKRMIECFKHALWKATVRSAPVSESWPPPHTPVNAYFINLYYINYININELSKELKSIQLIICGWHHRWCYWHSGYCCCWGYNNKEYRGTARM